MRFVNCFGLKFSTQVVVQHWLSCNEIFKLKHNGLKLESVTCKFAKNRSPSQLLFKEFHYKCGTAILKNAS